MPLSLQTLQPLKLTERNLSSPPKKIRYSSKDRLASVFKAFVTSSTILAAEIVLQASYHLYL
ncbi:hypothetical protein HPP92_020432 [Vanilla planifolia]|uniref:Uncharacterized protein n=1 Tax=Vanilla planifolia TaxID=51239 RepID=A0A835Q0P2_VANPL|nr:hypothetical protein HPP92_020432 [Vanilla planifolia]